MWVRSVAVLVMSMVSLGTAYAQEGRKEQLFNQDYRFALGRYETAAQVAFDDRDWSCVGVPHSFSIPYFGEVNFYVGEGWYRKQFHIDSPLEGRCLQLNFEAVFQKCDVYLNGQRAGGHAGGYTGFSVDLTPFIKQGSNVLAIRVDNRWDAQLPPRAGEHVFAGGIYRDVRLVETDELHVAYRGLRIVTPSVSSESASMLATVNIVNAGKAPRDFSVDIVVQAPDGAIVASGTQKVSLAADKQSVVRLSPLTIQAPELWHPDHPHLYTAIVSIQSNGTLVDSVDTRFGFRWFEFSADHGFFLNGSKLWLQGVNRHQDHAGWGDAIANSAHYRDAALIKEAGFNFVRGSHYPHDPAFVDACDELGLLMLSENTFWGIGGFGNDGNWRSSAYPPNEFDQAAFEANNKRLLSEMIADHHNHPSIILWSMSNEPFFTAKEVLPKALDHAKDLIELTHYLDPTRPAAIGGAQRAGFDKIGDVIGYNGDGANFKKPALPSIVTEYGSHVDKRPSVYQPSWGHTKGGRPEWRAGHALWCGFHHGSIAGKMGRMGIIDYFRLPLRKWYWYRNFYTKVPPPDWPEPGQPAALELTTSTQLISADGTQDAHLIVSVLDKEGKRVSASPDITLQIVSGPGEFPTGHSITFRHNSDIDVRDGQAAIAFRSWHAGETVIRATSQGLISSTVTIRTKGSPDWKAELADKWQKQRDKGASIATARKIERRDNIASVRPTSASSEEEKNPAHGANDGNFETRWCAVDARTPAFWQVDLENFYLIESVLIHFEKKADIAYRIEVSEDETNWSTIYRHSEGRPAAAQRQHNIKGSIIARFLRIVFTRVTDDAWPSLREVIVAGKPEQ